MNTHRLSALALLSLALTACRGDGGTPAITPPVTATRPTVTAISPDAGLIAGGTTVTLTGTNFKSGVSVNFGSALSSTVNMTSENTLTAISPEAKSPGKVDVTVSDGTASSPTGGADHFGYLAFAEYPVPTVGIGLSSITSGPDGNLWFTESRGDSIGKITPSGKVTEYPAFGYKAGIGLSDLTFGPDGNLWFTEFDKNLIGSIAPSGVVTQFLVPTQSSGLNSITSGPDGNLWFTEHVGNRIGRITPGGTVTEYAIPTANSSLNSITSGPDRNLWFTERNSNRIGRITPGGTVTEYAIPVGSGLLNSITSGPDGNLWFTHGERIGVLQR